MNNVEPVIVWDEIIEAARQHYERDMARFMNEFDAVIGNQIARHCHARDFGPPPQAPNMDHGARI